MTTRFVDRIEMQNRLFAELSRMFGREVPLYEASLRVNAVCNRAVCDLCAERHRGFAIADEALERTSGERHGAIRIGRPDEYRWVTRFFAAFAMEPHNFYDMTEVGSKSQPVIATAFRSTADPEHRVFCSLLMVDYFDPATRGRIDALLAAREVFSARAKELIERGERDGGLGREDAEALIREGTERIFRWTGTAHGHDLYLELCAAGFRIAADIACFDSHHLNHLTPNTLCMDLYTAAMRRCLGEIDRGTFQARAERVLGRLVGFADRDWMRLHFRHLTAEAVDAFRDGEVSAGWIAERVERLAQRVEEPDLRLHELPHSGFKDLTEGPPHDVPVLLRQDAYKALTEKVRFREAAGAFVETVHTARFGEIEQRFYATTAAGRALYDRCLAEVEAEKERDGVGLGDLDRYEAIQARAFAPFPRTLPELVREGLVHARWSATPEGIAAGRAGVIDAVDPHELASRGWLRCEGVRYEDFLPVSAAGIFASNLAQYGTRSTAAVKPTYSQEMLEEIMGRKIVDAAAVYAGVEADSLLASYAAMGLLDRLPPDRRAALERLVDACPDAAVSDGPSLAAPVRA
ncbi:MAG TPA: DUF1338 family protein [Phycisphaerales bacterium]|nr:DUF1338 family protein [Phycisphaerales bacterium]HMP35849.1 DUF1338 family protein [Phycisphaerales bacterium]